MQLRLVTVPCEVGGRWSETSVDLVATLPRAHAHAAPAPFRRTAYQAWASLWSGMLSIAQQDALAATIADDAVTVLDGHDDCNPLLTDVLLDYDGSPAISRLQ